MLELTGISCPAMERFSRNTASFPSIIIKYNLNWYIHVDGDKNTVVVFRHECNYPPVISRDFTCPGLANIILDTGKMYSYSCDKLCL